MRDEHLVSLEILKVESERSNAIDELRDGLITSAIVILIAIFVFLLMKNVSEDSVAAMLRGMTISISAVVFAVSVTPGLSRTISLSIKKLSLKGKLNNLKRSSI